MGFKNHVLTFQLCSLSFLCYAASPLPFSPTINGTALPILTLNAPLPIPPYLLNLDLNIQRVLFRVGNLRDTRYNQASLVSVVLGNPSGGGLKSNIITDFIKIGLFFRSGKDYDPEYFTSKTLTRPVHGMNGQP